MTTWRDHRDIASGAAAESVTIPPAVPAQPHLRVLPSSWAPPVICADPLHPASPRLRSSRSDLVPPRCVRLRCARDHHETSSRGTVGWTLNPFVVLNEPLGGGGG